MKQDVVQQVEQSRRLSWQDMAGGTLLIVGLVVTAVNLLGIGRLENWWSVFILLPGLLFLGMGRMMGLGNGRFSFLSRSSSWDWPGDCDRGADVPA